VCGEEKSREAIEGDLTPSAGVLNRKKKNSYSPRDRGHCRGLLKDLPDSADPSPRRNRNAIEGVLVAVKNAGGDIGRKGKKGGSFSFRRTGGEFKDIHSEV